MAETPFARNVREPNRAVRNFIYLLGLIATVAAASYVSSLPTNAEPFHVLDTDVYLIQIAAWWFILLIPIFGASVAFPNPGEIKSRHWGGIVGVWYYTVIRQVAVHFTGSTHINALLIGVAMGMFLATAAAFMESGAE